MKGLRWITADLLHNHSQKERICPFLWNFTFLSVFSSVPYKELKLKTLTWIQLSTGCSNNIDGWHWGRVMEGADFCGGAIAAQLTEPGQLVSAAALCVQCSNRLESRGDQPLARSKSLYQNHQIPSHPAVRWSFSRKILIGWLFLTQGNVLVNLYAGI